MRLQISKSRNAASLYIVKSTYDKNGKRSNKVVEKLGTLDELSKTHDDPIAWGHEYAKQLTEEEKLGRKRIVVEYNPSRQLESDKDRLFNGGYLFLKKIYHELQLDKICSNIENRHRFEYSLSDILSRLVYGRILNPGSKLSTYEESRSLLEQCNFTLQDVYRSLEVLADENEYIQSELFKNSQKTINRNTGILYYDCTNYYFETEEENGLRQYGYSKEHRPNPIIGMGLFIDGDGIPLAFSLFPGNTNEQTTLKPLEQMILDSFGREKFIVCTDAGLSSAANRQFNSTFSRSFITTQSLKNMKGYLKEWALSEDGWMLCGNPGRKYTLSEILSDPEANYSNIYYKERPVIENGITQRFIVTFSVKYMAYHRKLRNRQIERAEKYIEKGHTGYRSQNDPKRFINETAFTEEGEAASGRTYSIDTDKITREERYDGFYCVATSLEDDAETIATINKNRWEIEDCFRTMKTEFRARPVYLSKDKRIRAHFMTCFLALYIFRILKKKIPDGFTTDEIISCLRKMNFVEVPREGYIPAYTRTALTDALHNTFGFHTDYELLTLSELRKIFRLTGKA